VLKFLLDEHISPMWPMVCAGAIGHNIRYMVEWENGDFHGQEDSACLQERPHKG